MQKRHLFMALSFVALIIFTTGCSPNANMMQPINPEKGSFWEVFLVYPLILTLDWFQGFLGNYGLSILVVTLLVRILLLPLTLKQTKSSQAMQLLQPEMTKLREKYKDNQQKLQEETMKLFQKHKVNPMAGCVPALIQMPILIAFYQAIMRDPLIAKSTFLWMQLGQPDPYFLLPMIAAGTTFLQSKLMMAKSGTQVNHPLLIIMPLMILVLGINFPSALALYWVYGNLFSIVQYFFIQRQPPSIASTT
ncbi:membrane protein insertase YidC [Desmospora profundinema]|uniref:Membrane protein insertase YidC n=1 Tax=Desmospora profundinema TaxID=1571184 RepID=A0ABU1IRR3_9BACL|nr:membrane protein insertase YidC [Desmospora profundinema]MDR6227479.1 YidC/Oxa1 family membrane protein insertase [Desmospora profundinema]